jgi:hypothetical protein
MGRKKNHELDKIFGTEGVFNTQINDARYLPNIVLEVGSFRRPKKRDQNLQNHKWDISSFSLPLHCLWYLMSLTIQSYTMLELFIENL